MLVLLLLLLHLLLLLRGHVDPHHNIPRRAFKTIDMY
jgi:hypothetical protein